VAGLVSVMALGSELVRVPGLALAMVSELAPALAMAKAQVPGLELAPVLALA